MSTEEEVERARSATHYRSTTGVLDVEENSTSPNSLDPKFGVKQIMERLEQYVHEKRNLAPIVLLVFFAAFYVLSPHLPQDVKDYLNAILR
jgi:hypothetical protein